MIIFAAFEKDVTDLAQTAVRSRAGRATYQLRRAWDTIPKKPYFKDRVRLVLDQQLPSFATIAHYYDVRNELAHTAVTTVTFNIAQVVADLKAARKAMKK